MGEVCCARTPSFSTTHLQVILAAAFWSLLTLVAVIGPSQCNSAPLEVTLDIYVPLSCDTQNHRLSNTVTRTVQYIKEGTASDLDIKETVYDSCDEAYTLDTLVNRLSNDSLSNHVTIGPGAHALCEPIARLAHYYNKTIVSAQCTQKELSRFSSDYGYFMRTVPSSASLSRAISKLLRHFLWKRVAIVTSTSDACWTLSRDIYYGVTSDGFIVENVIEIDTDFNANAVRTQLQTIRTSTRGKLFRYFIC